MPTLHVRPEPVRFVRQSSPPARSAAKGAETPKRRRIAIDPDTDTEKHKQQDPQLLRALIMDATPSKETADSNSKVHKKESLSKEQGPRLLRAPILESNPINTSILHELVPLRLFERTKKPEGKRDNCPATVDHFDLVCRQTRLHMHSSSNTRNCTLANTFCV